MGPLALCAVLLMEENLVSFINSQIREANKDLLVVRHEGEVPSNHGNPDEIDCTGTIPKSPLLLGPWWASWEQSSENHLGPLKFADKVPLSLARSSCSTKVTDLPTEQTIPAVAWFHHMPTAPGSPRTDTPRPTSAGSSVGGRTFVVTLDLRRLGGPGSHWVHSLFTRHLDWFGHLCILSNWSHVQWTFWLGSSGNPTLREEMMKHSGMWRICWA